MLEAILRLSRTIASLNWRGGLFRVWVVMAAAWAIAVVVDFVPRPAHVSVYSAPPHRVEAWPTKDDGTPIWGEYILAGRQHPEWANEHVLELPCGAVSAWGLPNHELSITTCLISTADARARFPELARLGSMMTVRELDWKYRQGWWWEIAPLAVIPPLLVFFVVYIAAWIAGWVGNGFRQTAR